MQTKPLFFALPFLLALTASGAPRAAAQTARRIIRTSIKRSPTVSAVGSLLNRNDVRIEISLSPHQIDEVETFQKQLLEQDSANFRKHFPDFKFADASPYADATIMVIPSGAEASSPAREAKLEEARIRIREFQQQQIDADYKASEDKAKEILSPKQWKRLHELDLQWRGPLGLSEPKLAQEFSLTTKQTEQIATLADEYQKKWIQMAQDAMPDTLFSKRGSPALFDAETAAAKMERARTEYAKFHEVQDAKVFALLTEAQKSAWLAAEGKGVYFRNAQ